MCPGFLSPFGHRHSLLGHPLPAGELGLPHGRLTGPHGWEPDPDGVVTFHAHEIRPGWVPSIPRGLRCPHDRKVCPAATRRLTTASPSTPTRQFTNGASYHEASNKGSIIHPSGLPLACDPRMERTSLGFSPSFTPRRHRRRMSEWGQAMGTT
jgi:hypothetical protein